MSQAALLENQKGYPNGKVDYDHTKSIDIGDGVNKDYIIHYDEDGFPDFTKHCPGNNYVFTASDLKGDAGSSSDILRANKAMKQHFGNTTSDNFIWDGSSNNFSIRNTKPDGTVYEVKYTWHHHQDCNTMFPVPTRIHSSNSGGFQHSGGAKLIVDDLRNVFDPPIF